MSEWQKVKLVDVCVDNGVQTGPFGSQLHQKDYVDIGTPIITVEHLGDNRITMQNLPRVSHEDKERLSKYTLQEGDIVFSRVGSVDRRAYVRKEQDGWLFSGRCLRVRPDTQKIDPYYLSAYFGLPSFKEYVRSIAVGATMPSLNTTLLENVPIILPPKKQQELISHTAKSIEDKIELNQRMNETLEAMARALFKSWFVDFDPVRAKAEGRKPEGMDAATSALFPAAFNDDGLPEGWGKAPFSELIEIIGGGTPKTAVSEYWNGTIPWFSVVDAPADTDIYVVDTEKKVTQAGVDNSSTKVLPVGTTIISARGTVGRVALVGAPMAMNQSCYGIRGSNGLPDYFTYFCVRQLVAELQARTHGSVFDTITRDTFDTVSFIKPRKEIAEAFDERISPIMQKVLCNLHESKTLSSLRDTLLPKLISGELRVGDAAPARKEAVG